MRCKYCNKNGFKNLKGIATHRKYNKKCYDMWIKEQEDINNKKSFVYCLICNKKFRYISNTHLKIHNLNQIQYKNKFPNVSLFASGLLDNQKENRLSTINKIYKNKNIYAPVIKNFKRKYGEKEGKKRYFEYINKKKWKRTLLNFKRKYGEVEGEKRYFEYKSKVLNKCTLEWYINKYGIHEGKYRYFNNIKIKKYKASKQRYIDEYGKIDGIKKWKKICNKKSITLDNFQKKYGIKKGKEKFIILNKTKEGFKQSKIAIELFDNIKININNKCYYYNNPKEFGVFIKELKYYTFLDFYIKLGNKIIEFNGDYWHANPIIYNKDDVIYFPCKKIKAKEIWKKDNIRINSLEKQLNTKILIVWENEYKRNKKQIIKKCLDYINS